MLVNRLCSRSIGSTVDQSLSTTMPGQGGTSERIVTCDDLQEVVVPND